MLKKQRSFQYKRIINYYNNIFFKFFKNKFWNYINCLKFIKKMEKVLPF
jgi:hypothetical protein